MTSFATGLGHSCYRPKETGGELITERSFCNESFEYFTLECVTCTAIITTADSRNVKSICASRRNDRHCVETQIVVESTVEFSWIIKNGPSQTLGPRVIMVARVIRGSVPYQHEADAIQQALEMTDRSPAGTPQLDRCAIGDDTTCR